MAKFEDWPGTFWCADCPRLERDEVSFENGKCVICGHPQDHHEQSQIQVDD